MRMQLLILLLFFISSSLCKPVIEISTESFDDILSFKEAENVVIMYFDPSCQFCQKVKPDYIKAGELASDKLENIIFGTVDLENEYLLGHKNKINFVPAIRLYRKGVEDFIDIKYYSMNEIVNFIFRFFHLHSYELKTKQEVADFIRSYDTMGFYYGSENDSEFKIYKDYLELHENVQITFAHIFDKQIIEDMKMESKYKLAILRKENEDDFVYYQQEFTLPNLSKFLKREAFPLINDFDQKLMNEIFKTGEPLLIMLKKPKQKKNEKIDSQLKAACSEIRDKIRCCATFSDGEYAAPLLDKLGVSETELPQMRIIQGTSEVKIAKYKPNSNSFEKENILLFVQHYFDNKAERYYKSQSIPPETRDPIKLVVRDNYNSIVKNTNMDVLVEFFAPWCKHCEKAENLMKSLSQNLKKVKDLLFVRVDHSKNDIDGVEVDELPYILFYPRDDKENPIKFRDDTNYNSLVTFLKLHTTVDTSNTILHKNEEKRHHQDL